MEGWEKAQLQNRQSWGVAQGEEARMERRIHSNLEAGEEANLGETEARDLEGRENPNFPHREEARVGSWEEACVERFGEGGEGAGVGGEIRSRLEESVKACLGKGLGANRKSRSRLGLSTV